MMRDQGWFKQRFCGSTAAMIVLLMLAAVIPLTVSGPVNADEHRLFDLFDTDAPASNRINAYLLSMLSHYAYVENLPAEATGPEFIDRFEDTFDGHGLHDFVPIIGSFTDTEGVVAETDEAIIVTFRGTEGKLLGEEDYRDIVTDLIGVSLISADGIHLGFRAAALEVIDQVRGALDAAIADGSKPVWFTGHSLGGAVAQVTAFLLRDEYEIAGVVTVGQPDTFAVGLASLLYATHEINSRTMLWINNNDIIPYVVGDVESALDLLSINPLRFEPSFLVDLLLVNYIRMGPVRFIAIDPFSRECRVRTSEPLLRLEPLWIDDHETRRYSTRMLNEMSTRDRNRILTFGTDLEGGLENPPLPDSPVSLDCDFQPVYDPFTIAADVTGTTGSDGWYRSSVTVEWSVDGSPPDSIVSANGCDASTIVGNTTGSTLTCTLGFADGTEQSESIEIKIDTVPPSVEHEASRPADSDGWYSALFSVDWSGVDSTSGIRGCSTRSYDGPDNRAGFLAGWCFDHAGNRSDVDVFAFSYDATRPMVVDVVADRDPDSGVWYNAPVTVTWSGADDTSGVAGCTSTSYVGPDNGAAMLSGTCFDAAGNVSAPEDFVLAFDATAPTVFIEQPVDAASLLLDQVVLADFRCDDVTSGVSLCSGTVAAGEPVAAGAFGSFTFSATAFDVAGNSSTLGHPYRIDYALGSGLFKPPLAAILGANNARAGSRTPLRWTLAAADGTLVIDRPELFRVHWSVPVNCANPPQPASVAMGDVVAHAWSDDEMQYIAPARSDKSWSGQCRYLLLDLVFGGRAGALIEFD